MQDNGRAKKPVKSIILLTGLGLFFATLVFGRSTFAETGSPSIGERENKIGVMGIGMFDTVCIDNGYNQRVFSSIMDKFSRRRLAFDEYQSFLPGGAGTSVSFYDIPILENSEHVYVGRVSYKDASQNCIVVMRINEKEAMRHWLNLHSAKYSKNQLQRDRRAPYYFVDQGRKSILVQITHDQIGERGRRDFMAYYTFLK